MKAEMETKTRRRGINPFRRLSQTNAEVPSQAADVLTAEPEPKMTLGSVTKREAKDHRKRVLRNKVQKAK